jgi:hypothetical protein
VSKVRRQLVHHDANSLTRRNLASMRAGTAYTLRDIYDNHVVPLGCAHLSARTFTDWIQSGTKFAVLAAGGTVYILIMIAGLELRTTVSSMVGDSAWQLGNALRHPNPGKLQF